MRKLLILVTCILIGCSHGDKLDEDTATKGIRSSLEDKTTIYVETGRVGTDCIQISANGEELPAYLDPGISFSTLIAERAGYVTETPDRPGFWKVSLTDKGKRALAAGDILAKSVPPRKGCDYQQMTLILATSELVKITNIVAGKDSNQIDFVYRWRLTDLGRMLRQDGEVYKILDTAQRDQLKKWVHAYHHTMPVPAPEDGVTQSESVKVKKYPGYGWQIEPSGTVPPPTR